MMCRTLGFFGPAVPAAALAAATLLLSLPAPAAGAPGPSAQALPETTELWGGPGVRGTGAFGATFNTTVYISTREATTGTVEFWLGGRIANVAPVSAGSGQRWTLVHAPRDVDGRGPFLWHVRTDKPVSAWAASYTVSDAGYYGTSVSGFPTTDFLAPGDEAAGAPFPVSASTLPGAGRSNVGVLCSPLSAEACRVEVTAFDVAGSSAGSGTLTAAPGSAAQESLRVLVPGAASDETAYTARFRLLAGSGMPYGVRNDNRSSDAISVPLTVSRGAFSAAPRIDVFGANPYTGCSPVNVTYVWNTTNAARVAISGLGASFPPAGSTSATLATSTDVVLTATSASGASTSQPLRVTVLAPTTAPTPSPASGEAVPGGKLMGVVPAGLGIVTAAFAQQESTGSTFEITGNTFVYTAGATTGTDSVTLTSQGACGPATATFTATVSSGGAAKILSFKANPTRACSLVESNVVLTWSTSGVASVRLSGVPELQPPSGWYAFTYPVGAPEQVRTYFLSAPGTGKAVASASLSVPVDGSAVIPIATPAFVTVASGAAVPITLSLNQAGADPVFLTWCVLQNQSRGRSEGLWYPNFVWYAGQPTETGLDVLQFNYTNGCGTYAAEVRIQVVAPVVP